jgi:ASC-1-like (ASCH) protein
MTSQTINIKMSKQDRLFLPLKSVAFDWFAQGNKKYELRRLYNQYNRKYVKEGRVVELRRGYSGSSIWGQIGQVFVENSIYKLLHKVDFRNVIPVASSIDEAVSIAEEIVGNQGPYILFEIITAEKEVNSNSFIRISWVLDD